MSVPAGLAGKVIGKTVGEWLGVARAAVVRVEKRRQQAVDLEQAGACHLYTAVGHVDLTLLPQLAKALGEFVQNVRAELGAEVGRLQAAGFQLQDHLTDEQ